MLQNFLVDFVRLLQTLAYRSTVCSSYKIYFISIGHAIGTSLSICIPN